MARNIEPGADHGAVPSAVALCDVAWVDAPPPAGYAGAVVVAGSLTVAGSVACDCGHPTAYAPPASRSFARAALAAADAAPGAVVLVVPHGEDAASLKASTQAAASAVRALASKGRRAALVDLAGLPAGRFDAISLNEADPAGLSLAIGDAFAHAIGSADGGKPGAAGAMLGGGDKTPGSDAEADLRCLLGDFAYEWGGDAVWEKSTARRLPVKNLQHMFSRDAIKEWKSHPGRHIVRPEQVVFDPAERCGSECINLFRGWGVKPSAGDVAPFLDELRHNCNEDEEVMSWVLDWLAYPLQFPGSKMQTAILMHGPEGSGKNLLFECYAQIHGRHSQTVGQAQIESNWNEWKSGKTFILFDEVVSQSEKRHQKGKLKALITQAKANIEAKFADLRSEDDRSNMVFLSNETAPLALDDGDRRYCVIRVESKGAPALHSAFVAWRDKGGASALFDFLLARDLAGFSVATKPPLTEAKEDLIELGRTSPARFWRAWSAGEIYGLPLRPCGAQQAFNAYIRWCRLVGERFPQPAPAFAQMVKREAGSALSFRKAWDPRGTVNMWLPGPIPEGVNFSTWAQGCRDDFSGLMSRWSGGNFGGAAHGDD
ncbi:MAG: hypothetical protein RL722_530 [Pseudomonadota bacterium]|jgi:putative DNA primase/helicase